MNRKRLMLYAATVMALSLTASMTAMASEEETNEHTFSIDMTKENDEAWEKIAMVNDDTVKTGLNVRDIPSSDGYVIACLYRGGAVEVVHKDEHWTEVEVGDVTGFIKNEYLTYGTEAKGLAEHYGVYGVEASWNDVYVFENPDASAKIIHTAMAGETFELIEDQGHWQKVKFGEDDAEAYMSIEDVFEVILVDDLLIVDEPYKTLDDTYEDENYEDSYYEEPSYNESSSSSESSSTNTGYTDTSTNTGYTDTSTNTGYTDNSTNSGSTGGYTDNSGTTTETEAPAETEAPVETEAPAETEVPVETEAPAETEAPVDDSTSDDVYEDDSYDDEVYNDDTSVDADDTSDEEVYEDFEDVEEIEDAEEYVEEDAAASEEYAEEYVEEDAAASEEYAEEYVEENAAATEEYVEEYVQETEAAAEASASAYSSSDLDLMASIIYCEAGNQSYEGMVAVGAVVMNRVNDSSFPDTVNDVIYQSGQFTPASSGALDSALANGVPSTCYDAAAAALAGENPVGDALYFNGGSGSGMQIGDHQFY